MRIEAEELDVTKELCLIYIEPATMGDKRAQKYLSKLFMINWGEIKRRLFDSNTDYTTWWINGIRKYLRTNEGGSY